MIRTFCPGWISAFVAKSLEGGEGGGGHGGRLLEGEVRRLVRELVLSGTCVLGEGAVAGAEHVVASLKPRHVLADRLDRPRDIHAPNTSLGRAEPEAHDAQQVRQARHDVPVADMDASRVNAYEHVVVPDLGHVDDLLSSRTSRVSRTCPGRSPSSSPHRRSRGLPPLVGSAGRSSSSLITLSCRWRGAPALRGKREPCSVAALTRSSAKEEPMGAGEDVAVVRRGYEAFNTGDMDTLTELFEESASWHTPGRGPLAGDHEGRDGELCLLRPVGRANRRDVPGRVAALGWRW